MTCVSAWVFILFGAYMLLKKRKQSGQAQIKPSASAGFLTAFGLITVAFSSFCSAREHLFSLEMISAFCFKLLAVSAT